VARGGGGHDIDRANLLSLTLSSQVEEREPVVFLLPAYR
jgi:hypothetical protein